MLMRLTRGIALGAVALSCSTTGVEGSILLTKLDTRMLNSPAEKIETRLKALEAIKAKLDDLNKKNLLQDETTLKRVTDGIAAVREYAKSKDFKEDKVEKMFASIKADVETLKGELIKRAQELQGKMDAAKSAHEKKSKTIIMQEKVFDELIAVQDATLGEQLAVLKKYKGVLPVADEILAKADKFEDNVNVAMEFGQQIDEDKLKKKEAAENARLAKLEKDAHLKPDQAKSIMPILLNLEKQRAKKHDTLRSLDLKIHKIDATERFYKKQRASYIKEDKVLADSINDIEHGNVKKLQADMKRMGQMEQPQPPLP